LSGKGLCDELITRPEESYRLCCVVVCDLETSRIAAPYIYDISHLRVNLVQHQLDSPYLDDIQQESTLNPAWCPEKSNYCGQHRFARKSPFSLLHSRTEDCALSCLAP
jgi:hypothetical protein